MLNRCPKCRDGKIFFSLVRMHDLCPKCGYAFEPEQGFFLGAMSFSYLFGFIAVLPAFLYLLFSNRPLWVVVGIPGIQTVMLSPFLYRYSRLVWIRLNTKRHL